MKLAEALATTLRDWGLKYLFGVSGANIEHLHDAVYRLGGDGFRSVCAKSEAGAAFMADCRALHYLRLPANVSATVALGMGGMGYAIAGAVGAQLGSEPGSRTMVFCGDGDFLMLGTEVHTAVEHQLPILFVVFNNGMHGMCVTRQQLYFGGRIECSRYAPISVATVARGLAPPDRLWVGSAGTTLELTEVSRDSACWTGRPGVLELRLHREEIPPFTPFLPADVPTYPAIPLGIAQPERAP